MRRRDFITLLTGAAIAGPRAALAQTEPKIFRLGTLAPGPAIDEKNPLGAILLKALEQHGYAVGKNLSFEPRGAGGQVGKLDELVRELKAKEVDVIVAAGYPVILACKLANVPTVVAFGGGDPVATNLIDSLARPGGSITGISDDATTLSTKRLALIRQAVPNLQRVAMLWNRDDLGMTMRYKSAEAAARTLGFDIQPLGVREPEDFAAAFSAMVRDRPDAILMVTDALTALNRKRVFEFAAQQKLPAIYEYDFLVRDGGLMSYGPDMSEVYDRAADLADRILKGARPADLPFEQPTRLRLVINKKTLESLGLTIPAAMLMRADEVVE